MLSPLFCPRQHIAKNSWQSSKPCHVGIHWKALDEYYQMSTHVPGFQSFSTFFSFFHFFFKLFCFVQISPHAASQVLSINSYAAGC